MLQSPPPYVPVVEYVLKALEHPPFMYVAKLAACCTMLFLTRENPELLQELCHKWALRFRQDRAKLIKYIRHRASYCVNSPDASTELEMSDKVNSDEGNDVTGGESGKEAQRNDDNDGEVLGGIRCCEPDTAVEHLLSILNTLLPMYFSWNWHRADYVIQINKEYEAYVREFILPMCTALAPEEGVDDEERTPWLLPPHTYLDASQSTSGFYTPTSSSGGQFPLVKADNAAETRFGSMASGGGVSSTVPKSCTVMGSGAPTELEGLRCSTIKNHFNSVASGHRSTDRHTGVVSNPLPKFSPLHPTLSGGNYKDLPPKTASPAAAAAAPSATATTSAALAPGAAATSGTCAAAMQLANSQASGSSTVSVPAISPNAMSASVFNTSAVYGLRFLSLGTYRAALQHNTRGLVTVFHAKYSLRSNEVIEAFQNITAKRLLNPMPTIAVVYAVAEPELSTLYKVSWFPTIVYTPPLFCRTLQHSAMYNPLSQTQHGYEGGHPHNPHNHPSAAKKRHSQLGRRHHMHSHRRSRGTTHSASVTQPHSLSSQPLSGSGSLLDMVPPEASPHAAAAAADGAEAAVVPGDIGAAQHEEEGREQWEPLSRHIATSASRCNSEIASAIAAGEMAATEKGSSAPPIAVPLRELSPGAVAAAAPGESVATPPDATPTHPSPAVFSHQEGLNRSLPSGVSGLPSAPAPTAPTPTELLFGISFGDAASMLQMERTPLRPPYIGGADRSSLSSSFNDNNTMPQSTTSAPEKHSQQQPLVDMVEYDDHVIYPLRGDLTVPALVEWISSRGASVPRLAKLRDVSTCLKAIRQEEKFKRYRELHSAVVTLRRLQGQGQQSDFSGDGSGSGFGSCPNASRSIGDKSGAPQQPEQPLFIFLGGGMAAGKTTAVAALAKSSWWQGHKEQSVVVNADEFKLPQEAELASAEAHKHSTRAAENLLVQAVNQGRSIVLDGTMMWKPFVQQVVNMVRAAHLMLFKQGPGYDSKTKVEEYFVTDKKRQPALLCPYKIIFLGITVDVETAVPRGFLRKFSTNRGVPISTQLRSFKMFSENFADYVVMMDETTLYNNNVFVNLDKGELPPVMAECNEQTNHKLLIHDNAAFQQFVKQQQINENADNVMQVYPASPASLEAYT